MTFGLDTLTWYQRKQLRDLLASLEEAASHVALTMYRHERPTWSAEKRRYVDAFGDIADRIKEIVHEEPARSRFETALIDAGNFLRDWAMRRTLARIEQERREALKRPITLGL